MQSLGAADITALVDSLALVAGSAGVKFAVDADGARELLRVLEQLERCKAAAAAAQVRATVRFAEVLEQLERARCEQLAAAAQERGADDFTVWRARKGRTASTGPGVGAQVALARRLSDSALFASGSGKNDPGYVPGYGPVPSGWVRDLIRGTGTSRNKTIQDARVWLRRLYATPDSGQLVAMESQRRLFCDGLRRFLLARDKTCRTPWCDAPIRHGDHVHDHGKGGPTRAANGQGTCVRCNHTKAHPDWDVTVLAGGESRAGPGRTGPDGAPRWAGPTTRPHHRCCSPRHRDTQVRPTDRTARSRSPSPTA